jgi:hypothetical protein
MVRQKILDKQWQGFSGFPLSVFNHTVVTKHLNSFALSKHLQVLPTFILRFSIAFWSQHMNVYLGFLDSSRPTSKLATNNTFVWFYTVCICLPIQPSWYIGYIKFQSLLVGWDLPTDNFFSDLKTSGSKASLISDHSEWETYQTCLLSKHYYRCHLFTCLLAYVIK